PGYAALEGGLDRATQIPLRLVTPENDTDDGLRVPKAGWTEEPRPGEPAGKAATHRPSWPHRSPEPEGWAASREDRLAHALFGTSPDDVKLYDKPAARNTQLWTGDFRPVLDGPRAGRDDLR